MESVVKGKNRLIEKIFAMQPPKEAERAGVYSQLKLLSSSEVLAISDNLKFLGNGTLARTVVTKVHENLDHLRAAIDNLVAEADVMEKAIEAAIRSVRSRAVM